MKVLLLSMAMLFSSVASSGTWTRVDGGSWLVDQPVADDLRAEIHRQFDVGSRSYKAKHGVKTPQWDAYDFQYQGVTRKGVRLIIVNAFCKPDKGAFDFTKEMWVVYDGGSCYFHATYDPVRKIVIDFRSNGIG